MTLTAALLPKDPQDSPSDALAPVRLPEGLQLTSEQFAAMCRVNPNAVLELDASGTVIHMPPTGGETGVRNSRLLTRLLMLLLAWAERTGGWQLFDSSSGFRLPDGSVLSPNASMLRLQRWDALTPKSSLKNVSGLPSQSTEAPKTDNSSGISAPKRSFRGAELHGFEGFTQNRPSSAVFFSSLLRWNQ